MFLAKVTGSVVATQKVASMVGRKLLTVEPLRVDPPARQADRHRPDVRRASIRSAPARAKWC